jgi:periplasmic copper chaperone A
MRIFKWTSPLIVAGLIAVGLSAPAHAHGLEIEDAWTSGTPAVSTNHIAYLTIVNEAYHAEYLYRASTPVAVRVELHRTLSGTKMAPVNRFEIPLDDRLDMRRAGYHLMLIGVKRPLKPGEKIPITLTFEEGRVQQTSLTVAAAGNPARKQQ